MLFFLFFFEKQVTEKGTQIYWLTALTIVHCKRLISASILIRYHHKICVEKSNLFVTNSTVQTTDRELPVSLLKFHLRYLLRQTVLR